VPFRLLNQKRFYVVLQGVPR